MGGRKKSRARGWWDEECKEEKKKVKRTLREWRERNTGKKGYREGKSK